MLKITIGLMLLTCLLTNCKKDENVVVSTCDEPRLERLHNSWRLVQITRNDKIITKFDCIDSSCTYINVLFTDTEYELSYFLFSETENNTIDSIRHEESGFFTYEFCHSSNLNGNGGHYPGGYSNNGTITFLPLNGSAHASSFKLDLNVQFRLNELRIGDGKYETYFAQN